MFQNSMTYCAVCDREVEPDSSFLWDNRLGQAAHLCGDCLGAVTRFFARTRLQLHQRGQAEDIAKRLDAINARPALFVLQDEPQATPPQWIRDSVAGTEYERIWD